MVSLTLVFILINIILIAATIFSNAFKARIIGTALLIVDIIMISLSLFDSYINHNQIKIFLINLIASINLFGNNKNYAIFSAGLIVVLQYFIIWLVLYTLLKKWVPYHPPVLLSKKEKRKLLKQSILWKIILFISTNVTLIYVLVIFNYISNLPLGFLKNIFKFGFGVNL